MPSWKALFCCLGAAVTAYSQAPPPTAYVVSQVNSMFGPSVTQTISRSGSKAMMESVSPKEAGGSHTFTLYDLTAGTTTSWSAGSASACSAGKFSGDWGDPFVQSAAITSGLAKQNPKDMGAATVNGITRIQTSHKAE